MYQIRESLWVQARVAAQDGTRWNNIIFASCFHGGKSENVMNAHKFREIVSLKRSWIDSCSRQSKILHVRNTYAN